MRSRPVPHLNVRLGPKAVRPAPKEDIVSAAKLLILRRRKSGKESRSTGIHAAVQQAVALWVRGKRYMWMRETVISGMCAAFLNIGAATAMPENMMVDRLLAICEAPSVQVAAIEGDKLGWQRMTDAETKEWRTHFLSYNGGSVEAVGWRRKSADQSDLLSFLIATGPNGHKACTYSTTKPDGLLDALSASLGAPDTQTKEDAVEMISAYWKRREVEYSFTQVGSSATIAVGPSR